MNSASYVAAAAGARGPGARVFSESPARGRAAQLLQSLWQDLVQDVLDNVTVLHIVVGQRLRDTVTQSVTSTQSVTLSQWVRYGSRRLRLGHWQGLAKINKIDINDIIKIDFLLQAPSRCDSRSTMS